jgi:hypothetical protein
LIVRFNLVFRSGLEFTDNSYYHDLKSLTECKITYSNIDFVSTSNNDIFLPEVMIS